MSVRYLIKDCRVNAGYEEQAGRQASIFRAKHWLMGKLSTVIEAVRGVSTNPADSRSINRPLHPGQLSYFEDTEGRDEVTPNPV